MVPSTRPRLASVAIEVTARCNQRCTYCYNAWRGDGGASSPEPSTPELLARVDRVLRDNEVGVITLTGGEPFLRTDLLDVIDRVNAHRVPVRIISNGAAVTADLARALARRKVLHVQLTVAGHDDDAHDALCGAGSLRRVRAAAAVLADAGVTTGGSYLCTAQNHAQAGDALELLHALGVRQIVFNRFNPSGHALDAAANLLPTRTMVLGALAQADAFAARHGVRIRCTMPVPPCMMEEGQFARIVFGACSVGTEHAEYALGPDGGIRLCPLQQSSVGHWATTTIADIIAAGHARAFRAQLPEFCAGCPHAEACLGGCGAAAEWMFGTAALPDPFLAQHVMKDYAGRILQRESREAP